MSILGLLEPVPQKTSQIWKTLRLERFQVKQALAPYTLVLLRYYNSLLRSARLPRLIANVAFPSAPASRGCIDADKPVRPPAGRRDGVWPLVPPSSVIPEFPWPAVSGRPRLGADQERKP
jgi:hypothetical protein